MKFLKKVNYSSLKKDKHNIIIMSKQNLVGQNPVKKVKKK